MTPKLHDPIEIAKLYSTLKTINFSVGHVNDRNIGEKPNDYLSPSKKDGPVPTRFNMEESSDQKNPNLIVNMKLGENIASLKGDDDPIAVRQRQSTHYHTNAKPHLVFEQKQPHASFNKQRGDWILQNKFEYGYNPVGGRKLASIETSNQNSAEHEQIKQILGDIPLNYV